ncbi:MAG: hypothetical protein KAH17_06700, partial [Bacteroidales bacterium]|nr:hypothetical protein [Bacteroidales bacterium]
MPRKLFILILLVLPFYGLFAQDSNLSFETSAKEIWVDSVYNTLGTKERIAQLIMVPAWSERDSSHLLELEGLVINHSIGGIAFFQGGPIRQINMINRLQAISKVP